MASSGSSSRLQSAGDGGFQPRTKLDFAQVRERVRSEYGPAAQSEAEITGALADVDKDLEDCDAEVHRLQSHIIHVRNQRRRLEEYKTFLRSLISPIRKLPSEILSRVFDFVCVTNELTSKNLASMPALTISGVCSRWRALSRSLPNLWSRLRIDVPKTPLLHRSRTLSSSQPLASSFLGAQSGRTR